MHADADITDPVNQVRLLIADTGEGEDQLLPDSFITGYLHVEADNVKRAAAAALEAIAVSEVLVSKKIRTQDLSTDGPAVAKELREQARTLRAQADVDAEAGFAFDIVDQAPYGCV